MAFRLQEMELALAGFDDFDIRGRNSCYLALI